jgi:predicted methyltransferase
MKRERHAVRGTSQILSLVRAAVLLAVAAASIAGQRGSETRRDEWQRPEEVLDAMGARPGARVADVGAGAGYFTFKMAARVGPAGRVYAVDISESDLETIRQRKAREKLAQIEVMLGETDDPRLPEGLDGILVFNAYHEFREYDAMLAAMFHALRPGGRLVVIDRAADDEADREAYFARHAVTPAVVQAEAERHGFTLSGLQAALDDPRDSRDMFFLVFERPDRRD